jgi:NAD(P)-dependent dehydrogenase (short-subunit alcohol dehydrogenase family)
VNDLGGSMGGTGSDAAPAEEVAGEIGEPAIADTSDVSTPDGAAALVAAAVDRFGRLDAVVANAGIMRWATFPDVPPEDLDAHLAVHLGGSFHVARAAWPHLVASGAGRIVLTTSAGVFGLPGNTSYAAAKGGVIGLMRSLSRAGLEHGIKVNCIAPGAHTRMAGRGEAPPEMSPDLVAPMVAHLASEACPVTGEIYSAGFGRFARIVLAATEGVVLDHPTIEAVASNWDAIRAPERWSEPPDLLAWSEAFTSHLEL